MSWHGFAPHVPPPAPLAGWEAWCPSCGGSGSRDWGFVHQRETRCAVTFKDTVTKGPIVTKPSGAPPPFEEIST